MTSRYLRIPRLSRRWNAGLAWDIWLNLRDLDERRSLASIMRNLVVPGASEGKDDDAGLVVWISPRVARAVLNDRISRTELSGFAVIEPTPLRWQIRISGLLRYLAKTVPSSKLSS